MNSDLSFSKVRIYGIRSSKSKSSHKKTPKASASNIKKAGNIFPAYFLATAVIVCACFGAAAATAAISVVSAERIQKNESDDNEPKYFVIKNIAKTVHIILKALSLLPFIFSESDFRL